MNTLETAVRVIVDLLVRGEFTTAVTVTRGERLSAGELARAVADYPGTLVRPGPEWWSSVEITPVFESTNVFHVAAPMWTAEEGRSDLTLELRLIETIPDVFDAEILDLHVL